MVDVQNNETFRPYAACSNIQGFLARARSRNLPEVIGTDFLRVAGIPEAVFGRVMQTLRFLNLVTEDGRPTDTLVALSGATDTQFREILEKVVREAYRKEFQIVDPGTDNQPKIIGAFQQYQPRSQTQRMVMLFLGLCREAGIPVLDAPRERRMQNTPPKRTKPSAQVPAVTPKRVGSPTASETTARPVAQGNMLFGVTEEDVSRLEDEEFTVVWNALGKVARARARSRDASPSESGGGEGILCPVCGRYRGTPVNLTAHIRQVFDAEHIEWLDSHKDAIGCDSLALLKSGKWSPVVGFLEGMQEQGEP